MPVAYTFYERPILNSPYEYPGKHWELDSEGQPTDKIIYTRRPSELITPVPKPKNRKRSKDQIEMVFDGDDTLSTAEQKYDPTPIINSIRSYVQSWRNLRSPDQWQVTPETARLLQHWRHHPFQGIRPFYCQVEAVETAIWLAEVAPKYGKRGPSVLEDVRNANEQANPKLLRYALKLATGAGKTTVMAMLIAWQTINAVRRPGSNRFTRGFLICTPGLTVKDRLRVLQPNDPDSYYRDREIVPGDMLGDLHQAKIVITNYHAFRLRERMKITKTGHSLLKGRGPDLNTVETEGQMLQRVMPELMRIKNILVLNDEAHHCYRERPDSDENYDFEGDDKEEAKNNNEAARLWISGIETVTRKLAAKAVYDLSATPFFLQGSGYAEGTLFPWTVSDFSLMDAIESGIVKLPRVPVADNVPGGDTPKFRNLWKHIAEEMPKRGRGRSDRPDPLALPIELQAALEALYGHYKKVYELWDQEDITTPPVFIVVCNNTSTSKLVHDFISGFHRLGDDGKTTTYHAGRLDLFRNYDEHGNRLARPRTLLIDSKQLESGDALDRGFREMAADEISRFRREIVERTGDPSAGHDISDQDLLREVMNTVGKPERLGESIRCVVSVSMLTEGWDATTVTHILGVRAFGTQLLCEQVVGRALRRQSYDVNEDGLFDVEYADILGIPFDFAAEPIVGRPKKPRKTIRVYAVRPERDHLEIKFPRVAGYRVELPEERLTANFSQDSELELNPSLLGPSITKNQGIIGKGVDLEQVDPEALRRSTILFRLTKHLLYTRYRDPGEEPKLALFGQLKRITRQWMDDGCLRCTAGTNPAQVLYPVIADMACERIKAAIIETLAGKRPVKAILDAYNPIGSTAFVNFTTSKMIRWATDSRRCHVNWAICDSDWELEFCRVAESHPKVLSYIKNQNLGFEVPYLMGSRCRTYIPDFIVRVDDGSAEPVNVIVEIKGYRGENAKDKANTMRAYWVPGVNNLGIFGRWSFAEFTAIFEIHTEFNKLIRTLAKRQAA